MWCKFHSVTFVFVYINQTTPSVPRCPPALRVAVADRRICLQNLCRFCEQKLVEQFLHQFTKRLLASFFEEVL